MTNEMVNDLKFALKLVGWVILVVVLVVVGSTLWVENLSLNKSIDCEIQRQEAIDNLNTK